jgi:tetratricopeptide (TPR) repeat protein
VLYQLGRPLEAEKLLRRAIELEHADSSTKPSPMLLTNYAQMLVELRHMDAAETYAERALEEGTQAGSPIVVNQTRLRLSRIYRARHEPVRATQMLDEAERSMRTLLPAGHFAFGALAAERALTAQQQGDSVGALKFINQAIQIDEQAGRQGKAGAQFLPILLTYRAGIELDARQLSSADGDARQAIALLEVGVQPGDYSSYTGRAYLTLARVLNAEGKASEARSAAQRAAQELEKAVGAEHPEARAAAELSKTAA